MSTDADNTIGSGGRLRWLTVPVLILIIANLAPVYGVLFLGWTVFPLILFFWCENVVIGIFNILKMLLLSPTSMKSWLGKLFIIPFFSVHYGVFTTVHGVFVFGLFGEGLYKVPPTSVSGAISALNDMHMMVPIMLLIISHGVSFGWNYVWKGEFRTATLDTLMGAPYARVVVLHVVLLIGGFLAKAVGAPIYALLLMVVLKIAMDVPAHINERRKFGMKDADEMVLDC